MSDVSVSVSGGAVAATVQSGFRDAASDGNTYGRRNGEWANIATTSALQFRQGTNADRLAMDPVPLIGEPIYTTDGNRLFIGDGSTVGGRGLVGDTDSYVICQPGDDIQEKYTQAKALTPGGSALSATNRAALLVFPGTYSVSDSITIDEDFVDVVGLGAERWFATVRITGSNNFLVTANDVFVSGIQCVNLQAGAGGANRIVQNCVATRIYDCGVPTFVDGVPNVIGGTIIGCWAFSTSNATAHNLGGGSANNNIFTGTFIDCRTAGFLCRNVTFHGVYQNCIFDSWFGVSVANRIGFLQGRFIGCRWDLSSGASLPARSTVTLGGSNVAPGAFSGTCTISNASPAVVTKSSHGLYTGVRIRFETDGALPTGLSTTTTYYVKVVDSNSFEVSATINGSSVNTTGAGSGSHSIVIPPGVEGGRYSYCTTSDGEFTTT